MKSKLLMEIIDELRECRYFYDSCSIALLKAKRELELAEDRYTRALEYHIRNSKEELNDESTNG